ncbi:MAG: TauD/TfdA family dioxygenase, partial [Pseudomonadota bacterium]|nr:TauD/TfdA family dioxygenase [Pseudomonadota bacterium]
MIEGPEAWHGNELAEDSRWRVYLDDNDIAELESALQNVKERGLAWRDMKKASDFPLNRFSEKLVMVSAELEDGCGLVNIKGFPVDRFDDEDINRVWYGISLNLGTPIYQNYCGELLRDIIDEQQDTDAANNNRLFAKDGSVFHSSRARTASNGPLRFHTDRADAVGLFCVRQAAAGGLSKIASSVRVNNEIVKRRPDLAALLYDVVYRSRHGEEKDGSQNIYGIPVFGVRDGKFTSHYSRT